MVAPVSLGVNFENLTLQAGFLCMSLIKNGALQTGSRSRHCASNQLHSRSYARELVSCSFAMSTESSRLVLKTPRVLAESRVGLGGLCIRHVVFTE